MEHYAKPQAKALIQKATEGCIGYNAVFFDKLIGAICQLIEDKDRECKNRLTEQAAHAAIEIRKAVEEQS